MTAPSPSAPIGVVFDLDGVLIDSHDQHERSWFRLAGEIGRDLTPGQFKQSFGMRNEQCIPEVFGWAEHGEVDRIRELGDRKEAIYRELLREDALAPLPGAAELLEDLAAADVPASLGSSTPRENIEACFASTGLDRFFGERFTGAEDVARGKPAPDVFLEAARKIDRSPERCVVIEDARVGVEAALSGGMCAVAVTTTHPRERFAGGGAALVVDSLRELDAARLSGLISSADRTAR